MHRYGIIHLCENRTTKQETGNQEKQLCGIKVAPSCSFRRVVILWVAREQDLKERIIRNHITGA